MPPQTGIAWRRVISAKVAPTPATATHSGNLLASGHRHVSDTSMLWQGDTAQMYPWEEGHWMATRDKDPEDLREKAGGPDPGKRKECLPHSTYIQGRASSLWLWWQDKQRRITMTTQRCQSSCKPGSLTSRLIT